MKFTFIKRKFHEESHGWSFESVYIFKVDDKIIKRWGVYKTFQKERMYASYAAQYWLGSFNNLNEAKAAIMEEYLVKINDKKESK